MKVIALRYSRGVLTFLNVFLIIGLSLGLCSIPLTASAEAVGSNTAVVQFQFPTKELPPGAKSHTATAKQAGTVQPADTTTVTCYIQIQNPHNSTHVPGQVNVVGTANCDIPMNNIWLDVYLDYYGENYAWGGSYDNYGKTSAWGQANYDCYPGTWSASMDWTVSWPPNATPTTPTSGTVYSPSVDISC